MEESQHAKLDTLMVQEIFDACTDEERAKAIDGYLEIGGMLDEGLAQQVKFDLESLEARNRPRIHAGRIQTIPRSAAPGHALDVSRNRDVHKNFLAVAELVQKGSKARLEAIAPLFS